MKKINSFSPKLVLSIILVFAAAYVFRVGYMRKDWIMYIIGVLLFVAAYYIQTKKK